MDYSFNLSSKQIFNSKKSLELLLIPSFQKKSGNFFEILVYQPHLNFKINFALKDLKNNIIYDKNNQDTVFMDFI